MFLAPTASWLAGSAGALAVWLLSLFVLLVRRLCTSCLPSLLSPFCVLLRLIPDVLYSGDARRAFGLMPNASQPFRRRRERAAKCSGGSGNSARWRALRCCLGRHQRRHATHQGPPHALAALTTWPAHYRQGTLREPSRYTESKPRLSAEGPLDPVVQAWSKSAREIPPPLYSASSTALACS